MLVDALRSETFRLLRNRATLFWSVLFVPVVFTVGGVGYHLLAKSKAPDLAEAGIPASMGATAVNLGDALTMGAAYGANGVILVMTLVAAATLYAGDYRWETWRLISARNARLNLILGKVGVLKLVALAAMAAFLVACGVFIVAQAVIFERPVSFTYEAADWGKFALTWLLGMTRIVQYAMLALLTAVATRSLLASLLVPIGVGFAQSIFGQAGLPLLGWEPTAWKSLLLLPGLAYDSLKAVVQSGEGAVIAPLTSLATWTLVPLIAAVLLFHRQDLSKE